MIDFSSLSNLIILVIGYGSIGKRHVNNLLSLGFSCVYVLSRQKISNADNRITFIRNLETIKSKSVYATIICSATSEHILDTIKAIGLNSHILIEKPITNSISDLDKLKVLTRSYKKIIRTGYMLRYHPAIIQIKNIIKDRRYGEVLYCTTYWSEYLPNWHPFEDYALSYAARKDLGGGVALTLSHDIDLVSWLFDFKILSTKSIKSHGRNINVDVETGFDVLYAFEGGFHAHTHLDFNSKFAKRVINVVFESATIEFDYLKSTFFIKCINEERCFQYSDFNRNNLFIDELVDFFIQSQSVKVDSTCNVSVLSESEIILNICLNTEWSSTFGR